MLKGYYSQKICSKKPEKTASFLHDIKELYNQELNNFLALSVYWTPNTGLLIILTESGQPV